MSNKHIAINWAVKQVKAASGFVYSDQFFSPFSESMKKKIATELSKYGVLVWGDTKQGAFLFKCNDKRLLRNTNGTQEAAVWHETDKIMILPTRYIGSI